MCSGCHGEGRIKPAWFFCLKPPPDWSRFLRRFNGRRWDRRRTDIPSLGDDDSKEEKEEESASSCPAVGGVWS